MADKKNPFDYKVKVSGTDVLKNAISSAEKYSIGLAKEIHNIGKSMGVTSKEFSIVDDQAKKASKSVKNQEDNFSQSINRRESAVHKHFSKEREALNDAGIGWGRLTSAIGGGTVIGIIYKSVEAYMALDKTMRSLNPTLYGNTRAMGTAQSMIHSLNGYLGLTREEIRDIVEQGSEFGLFTANSNKSAAALKTWTMQVIYLSKATDVGTHEVGSMFFQMEKLYKIPIDKLKNIGSAFSYIQKQTAISGSELATFSKSLEDIFMRLPDMSGDARTKLTTDMMAIAGVVKNKFGDPEEVSKMFSKMLHIGDPEGEKALAYFSTMTGKSMYAIRDALSKGDVVGLIEDVGGALSKYTDVDFQRFSDRLTEQTGLTYKTMYSMRQMFADGGKGLRELVEGSRKASEVGNEHVKAAQARQNKLSWMWQQLKNSFEEIFLKIGEHVVKITTKFATIIVPYIEKGIHAIVEAMEWFESGEGEKWVGEFVEKVKGYLTEGKEYILIVGKTISDFVHGLIDTWSGLTGTEKSIVKWAGAIGAAFAILGGKLTPIVMAITAIIEGKKWLDKQADKEMEVLSQMSDIMSGSEVYITKGLKGSEHLATEQIKSLFKTGIVSKTGDIDEAKIRRIASKTTINELEAAKRASEWVNTLQGVTHSDMFKKLSPDIKNRAFFGAATYKEAAPVETPEYLTKPSYTFRPDVVKQSQSTVVVKDSEKSESLMTEIRDNIKDLVDAIKFNRTKSSSPAMGQ
jgi:TP901 family phage tail tape measure protein